MKKLFSLMISCFIIFASISVNAASPVKVYLNEVLVEFDQEVQIINDRTYVPVRAIFEALGANVVWNGTERTVTSSLNEKIVLMTIDSTTALVNETEVVIDAAPKIIGNRTYVPARAVSEMYDCDVFWENTTRSVIIKTEEFIKRCENANKYTLNETLFHQQTSAQSSFNVMYLDGFNLKTNAPDGTKIDLAFDSETFHANLNIRADVYTGANNEYTDEYVRKVAEDTAQLVSGKLINYGVVNLNGTDFIHIEYTAPRTVSGISDSESKISAYMGVKNGVVYTITLSQYGEVNRHILEDLNYTINSINIL